MKLNERQLGLRKSFRVNVIGLCRVNGNMSGAVTRVQMECGGEFLDVAKELEAIPSIGHFGLNGACMPWLALHYRGLSDMIFNGATDAQVLSVWKTQKYKNRGKWFGGGGIEDVAKLSRKVQRAERNDAEFRKFAAQLPDRCESTAWSKHK